MTSDQQLLNQINEHFKQAKLLTLLAKPSPEYPVHQLRVQLESQYQNNHLRAEMILLPDLSEPLVLQFFVPFPFTIHPERIGDVARLLHMLNNASPVSGFGMMESSYEVYYRLLLPINHVVPDFRVIIESLFVFDASISIFINLIAELSKSSITFEQAAVQLQQIIIQMSEEIS